MDFFLDDPKPSDTAFSIDFRAHLNDEQYNAVTAPPGPLLVLAGAGSGKTRTLTYRVAWLLAQGVRPWEILLLTFTNKAAKEMLHRVQELTGVEPAQFWGGTFHSIGNRLLRRHAKDMNIPANFTILDADESENILKKAVEKTDRAFFKDKLHPRPGPLHNVLSLSRNTRTTIHSVVEKYFPQYLDIDEPFVSFAKAYEEEKLAQNVLDYDDLLERLLDLFQQHPEVLGKYQSQFRHILVDEYQDTNALQSCIIDTIGSHHQIMAVGDDAQCIYSWRGADFENIMTFPDRHPDTVIHRIETNYRSTPQILALANSVLNAQPRGRHFDKELRAQRANSQKPFLVQALDSNEQARFILKRIRSLTEDEGCSLSDIAILYRAHYQALEIQLELSRQGIPYQITSGVKFFERQHIRDLIAILRFLYNPADTSAWERIAVLLPKVGEKSAAKIHSAARDHAQLLQQNFIDTLLTDDVKSKVPSAAKPEWEHFCLSLKQVGDAMSSGTPAEVTELAIDGWYGDYMKGAYADYNERLEELKALVGFAARFTSMQDMLAQIVLLNGESAERNVDADADALRLTTIHQAKGLEYSVVFLINLADGMFPIRRAIEEGDVEEERRLFYVGVTRAKDELYLSFPKIATRAGPGGMMLTPSRFLTEINSDLYEPLQLRRNYAW